MNLTCNTIMSGCKVVTVGESEIMFGCPSEVIKVFALKGSKVPGIIVLPRHFYLHGIVQASLEFPNYNSLFAEQRYFKGEKLVIIGTSEQNQRMRELLQLTLLGPSDEDMISWNISEDEKNLQLRMSKYFALKKLGKNEVAQIDDLIEFQNFDDQNQTTLPNNVQIQILGNNIFRVKFEQETIDIDITVSEIQSPPIVIDKPNILAPRGIFGATALSKMTTGFDPTGYTSGFLLGINSMFISVDGVPWMKEHLRALGVNPHEITAHIVTHIHDDHSNIFDLIVNGQVFHLISDILGYRCLVKKASLLLNISEEEVMNYVKCIEFKFDQPLNWYGAKFEFWRVAHPVPTFGFRVSMNGKAIIYSGDTCWGKNLTAMYEKQIIPEDMYQKIKQVPFMQADVIFHDAGGGMIHPDIHELAELPPIALQHIVPTHIPQLPDQLKGIFSEVYIGKNWDLVPAKNMKTCTFAQIQNAPIFNGISDHWMNVVINQGRIQDYPCDYDILELGEPGKCFYVIMGGCVNIVDVDHSIVSQLATGDFFGEISMMYQTPCSATVRTVSPVRLLELDRDVFMQLILGTNKDKILMKIHQMRHIFMQFSMFNKLPSIVLNELYQCAYKESFAEKETIIRKGEVGDKIYGVIQGTVVVYDVDEHGTRSHIADIHSNQVFGEIALIENSMRTADVVATSAVKVFSINREDFNRIMEKAPMLRFLIGKIAASRR